METSTMEDEELDDSEVGCSLSSSALSKVRGNDACLQRGSQPDHYQEKT